MNLLPNTINNIQVGDTIMSLLVKAPKVSYEDEISICEKNYREVTQIENRVTKEW